MMAKRGGVTWMVLAGGMAAAALRYGGSSISPALPTAQEAPRSHEAIGAPETDESELEGRKQGQQQLRSQLCRFIGGPVKDCSELDKSLYPMEQTDTAIAIFPDPIHTHLALRFDRSVDALVAAAQDAGWYLDRQWVPWSWMQPGEPVGEKNLKDVAHIRMFRQGFELVPGVIFFRPITPNRLPLVVFVVGDAPISGIIPGQFRVAYEYARQLQRATGNEKELKIIGPNFSGSIWSLERLLKEQEATGGTQGTETGSPKPFTSVLIRSPTIAKDLQSSALNQRNASSRAGGISPAVGPRYSFASYGTILTAKVDAAVRFFDRQTGPKTIMAVLREDQSQFGYQGEDESQHGHQGKERVVEGHPLLNLAFPRDISHLRTAYQKKSVWGFGSSGGAGRVSLDLDFEDPHEEQDAAPSFAGQQTAASLESEVRLIADTLKVRDVQVVMLSASDVFDELFLARMLKLLAPQVTIVVLDSDALFLRQGSADNYNHVFAVTPFPLIPANSAWTLPRSSSRQVPANCSHSVFASESQQGAYVAAGSVLGGERFVRDNPCTAGYTSPLWKTTRPPLWVLAIEGGSYWPYAAIDMESLYARSTFNLPAVQWEQGTGASGEVAGVRLLRVPALLWVGMFSLLLLSGFHGYGCMWAHLQTGVMWNYAVSDDTTRNSKLKAQLGMTLIGILAVRLLVPANMTQMVDGAQSLLGVGWALMIGLGALAGALTSLLLGGGSLRTPGCGGGRLLTVTVLAGLVLPWASGWLMALLRSKSYDEAGVDAFVRYRSLFLLSGSSSSMALLLLLAAVAFALLTRMSRTYFSGPWQPKLPSFTPVAARLPNMGSVAPIHALDSSNLRQRTILWSVVLVTLALMSVAFHGDSPESMDGRRYSFVLQLLVVLVMALLAYDLLRAAQLWRLTRLLLLRPLERTPLRRGFDRIKGMAWTRLWKTMTNSPQISYLPARRAIELAMSSPDRLGSPLLRGSLAKQWQRLAQLGAKGHVPLARLEQGGPGGPTQLENRELTGDERYLRDKEFATVWGHAMDALADVAEEILEKLEVVWQDERGSVTEKDDIVADRLKALGTEDKVVCAQEEFVALVYVQYVHIVLIQIRNSLLTSVACYVLLAAALTGYPILNRHAVETGLLVLFCLLALTVVVVYASINRDSILSRTTESEPGKLDTDFYYKLLGYLALPLLGLLVSQFPELSGYLFSWVQPGLGTVK